MTPFQEFRFWARRAPSSERVVTGIAAVIVLALLGWLLAPGSDDSSELATSEDEFAEGSPEAPTATTAAGTSSNGGGSNGGGSSAGGGGGGGSAVTTPGGGSVPGGSSTPGATGCVSPPGTAKGITANQITVAIALTEIVGPAANEVFDIPSADEQRLNFDAIIAGINKEGGAACRKLVPKYYTANPTSESQMRGLCLDMKSAGVFAVVDTGSLATRPAVLACFGQNKLPYFGGYYITEGLRQKYFPYIFSFYTKEQVYKNTAFALRDRGFFSPSKGFDKLGFLYRDCEATSVNAFRGWLRQAGVSNDEIEPFNVGCPEALSTPEVLANAVLTFQREGVTHVTTANEVGDLATFTTIAERNNFRPKYGFPDEAMISVSEGTQAPNGDNIANAIAITLARDAEQVTPGLSPSAGTKRCDAYFKAAGRPVTWKQAASAGNGCNQLWMLREAVSRAPQISALGLVTGLQRAKSIDFSYPTGPNDFSGNRVTTGGQFWRVARFVRSCDCWRVLEAKFRPNY